MHDRQSSVRYRSLDPTHNALVATLRQALTDIRCFETWFRKEDEGTGYGQPHLGQADARRAAERIEAVLRDHTHQDDGFLPRDHYRVALERIANQGDGTFDPERRQMMGDTGEPWEHWAALARRALDAA